jgi:hypothetical protein
MNRPTSILCKLSASTVLAVLSAVSTANVWAASQHETVNVQATDLQAKADHYAKEAAYYRARAIPASKQMIIYFTLANRYDRLSKRYHMAALAATARG